MAKFTNRKLVNDMKGYNIFFAIVIHKLNIEKWTYFSPFL